MSARSSSSSCPLHSAICWNNIAVNCLQEAKYTQAASSFTNALRQLKNATPRINGGRREATDSSSIVTPNGCLSIVPSGMELPSTASIRPSPCFRTTDIQALASKKEDEAFTIFRHAFLIETESSELHSSDEYSSRRVGLICGTILLNSAIMHHLRYLKEGCSRSRFLSHTLYKMAIDTILASSAENTNENDIQMNDRNSLLFRFAVIAALNNALDVVDDNESLEDLLEAANGLYGGSLRDGISWQEQISLAGADEEDHLIFLEWEAVFRINASTMKLKALGLLHKTYTASAA